MKSEKLNQEQNKIINQVKNNNSPKSNKADEQNEVVQGINNIKDGIINYKEGIKSVLYEMLDDTRKYHIEFLLRYICFEEKINAKIKYYTQFPPQIETGYIINHKLIDHFFEFCRRFLQTFIFENLGFSKIDELRFNLTIDFHIALVQKSTRN